MVERCPATAQPGASLLSTALPAPHPDPPDGAAPRHAPPRGRWIVLVSPRRGTFFSSADRQSSPECTAIKTPTHAQTVKTRYRQDTSGRCSSKGSRTARALPASAAAFESPLCRLRSTIPPITYTSVATSSFKGCSASGLRYTTLALSKTVKTSSGSLWTSHEPAPTLDYVKQAGEKYRTSNWGKSSALSGIHVLLGEADRSTAVGYIFKVADLFDVEFMFSWVGRWVGTI